MSGFTLEQWTAPKKTKRKTVEGVVLDDVTGFLEARGWLVVRFQSGLFVGYGQVRTFMDKALELLDGFDTIKVAKVRLLGLIKKIRPSRIGTTTLGWKGFPDLIAIRHNGRPDAPHTTTLFIECKRENATPDPDQRMLLEKLRRGFRMRALYTDGLDNGKQPFRDYYQRRVAPFLDQKT